MVESGASAAFMLAELFHEHPMNEAGVKGTRYSTAAASATEAIINKRQRHVQVYDHNGVSSWARFRVCAGLSKGKSS